MTDLFLGIIALAVVTMAAIQVGAIIVALRTARHVGETVARLEADVKPIVANLQTMSADAARAAGIAVTQAERAEQLIADLTARVNETAEALHASLIVPAREALSVIRGLIGALSAFRQPAPSGGRRPAASEDEDPLFIG